MGWEEPRRLRRRLQTRVRWGIVALCLTQVAGLAAEGPADRWDRTVTRIEEVLRKSGTTPAWRAQQLAQEALSRQLDDIAREAGNRGRLARLLALAAVAAQRLGDTATAQWLVGEAAAFEPAVAQAIVDAYAGDQEALRRALAAEVAEQAVRLFENPPAGYVAPEPQTVAPLKARPAAKGGPPVGTVKVLVVVDQVGLAQRPLLLQSSGHLGFDLAAMDSVREWVFRPATREGKATLGAYLFTVTLHSGP